MSGIMGRFRRKQELSRLWLADLEDHVISLGWSPDGRFLAAASVSGPISVFNAVTGLLSARLKGHGFGTTQVAWSPDGQVLASAGQDATIRLWDVSQAHERAVLPGGSQWVEQLAWSPGGLSGGPLLASAAGRKLRLWDAQGNLLQTYPDHPSTISALGWKPAAPQPILTSAAYGQLGLWQPGTTEPVGLLEWKGSILTLAWSPDGKFVATGDQDCTVHFWVLKTGQDFQMSGYGTKVRELAWDATARYLATGGGPAVTIWDCAGRGPGGTKPLTLSGHERPVSALAYQKTGPFLASGGKDGRLVLWQPNQGNSPHTSEQVSGQMTTLVWSANDRMLAGGTSLGQVAVWGFTENRR